MLEGAPPLPAARRSVQALSLCAALLAVTACNESDDPREATERQEVPAATAPLHAWLTPDDAMAPEVWLASRQAGRALPAADPRVAAMAHLLGDAAGRFQESPRMIANRAVQLEGTLRQQGQGEPLGEVVADLIAIAGEARQRRSFGDLGEYYARLRAGGRDRDAAIATLRQSYGQAP